MPLDDGAELWAITRPHVIRLLEIAWSDAAEAGLVDAAFDLELPEVQEVLDTISTRVKTVAGTTREAVMELVGQAAREGHGVDWLTDQLQEHYAFSPIRAEVIAATETAQAYSAGAMLAYKRSGQVRGTEWLLAASDFCPKCEEAAARGVVPLGEEYAPGVPHPPMHTRCRCSISAVLE